MSKPLVGLTANLLLPDPRRAFYPTKELHYLHRQMVDYIHRHGALPVLIPGMSAEVLAEYVDRLDGLILSGGQDIGPELYGETLQDERWRGNEPRDRYEWELIRLFIEAHKPILGICRGFQFLNIYFGGTLYQDISSQRPACSGWLVMNRNFNLSFQ